MRHAFSFLAVIPLLCSAAEPTKPTLDADSYNQWKKALKTTAATGAGEIRALPGFAVELVRAAKSDEGSWVALAFDDEGRVIIAREDRGLLRLDLKSSAVEPIEGTVEEARGLVFQNGELLANANNGRALVRLRDADGDGKFESRETLRATPGGVGHGRNQIARGGDGALWAIHGDDVRTPVGAWTARSQWREDRPFQAAWDKFHWSHSVTSMAGHLVRTDAEGKAWEIVCGGLRNPFGIALDAEGEAFTYDADMEWDVGLPWYRPTRILHLVSGADYGWRGASRAMPAWLPDTWPAVCDIGKGSPTAVAFGTGAAFPARYTRALYALDWAYGVIYAVHLRPVGAGWRGEAETFLQGRPLNVTGIAFANGALFFTTGGRRTTSGLYRVTWPGAIPAEEAVAKDASAEAARKLRRKLEAFHGGEKAGAVEFALGHLTSEDVLIRRAARVALENQPPAQWTARVLETGSAEGMLAVARAGTQQDQAGVLKSVANFRRSELAPRELATALRAAQVSIIRHGGGTPELRAFVESAVPSGDREVDHLGIELLVLLSSQRAVAAGLGIAGFAKTQEERLHHLFTLRHAKAGWSLEYRRKWLVLTAAEMQRAVGAHHLGVSFRYAVADFNAALSPDERAQLASELNFLNPAAIAAPAVAARSFVREWKMGDAEPLLSAVGDAKRDLKRGRELFRSACAVCHRFGPEGGAIGPDLTGIAGRFDRRAILESIIEPWRVVADPYRYATAMMASGEIVSGRVLAENEAGLLVEPNPIEPGVARPIPKTSGITSQMPPGLLNTMTQDEWLDLLAWMERGGSK